VPGKNPLFSEPLHVGRPNLGDRTRLLARFEDLLDRQWLTNDGPYLQEFEAAIAECLGVRHCVVVCNATIGLQLAIRALNLQGEVIVPAFTFPATVHALALEGATPVFCDVDPNNHCLDPREAERLITPLTSAILGVHLWGNPCAVDALDDLAKRRGLRLLYDAAHAFGCSHAGRMIGNFGDAEVFSFHATKFLNSGEGGAIVTNDDVLAERLRRLRSFGLHQGEVVQLGTNAKMTEFCAAMGLTSLESRELFIERNRENHAAYQSALAETSGIQVLFPEQNAGNAQYVVVEVDARQTGITRDDLCRALHAENVLAKRYFWPGCHRMPPYARAFEATGRRLLHTDRLCECLLQFPTGCSVSHLDVARIGNFLQRLVARLRRAA
jgi:dTDP-4-amino-4,6-dideoxygalactose transaminase